MKRKRVHFLPLAGILAAGYLLDQMYPHGLTIRNLDEVVTLWDETEKVKPINWSKIRAAAKRDLR